MWLVWAVIAIIIFGIIGIQESEASISETTPWPKITFDAPSQVQLGDTFNVNITWTFVEFDEEEGTIDDISVGDPGVTGVGFSIYINNGTELISAPDFELTAKRTSVYNYTTSEYKKVVEYDDTQIHHETYTFRINEPAPHPYNRLSIWIEGHQNQLYFDYNDETVVFSDKEIIPESVEALKPYAYQGITIIETNENAQTNPQFIDDLAEFLKNNVQTKNMTQFLIDEGISENTIEELFSRHPELKSESFGEQELDWLKEHYERSSIVFYGKIIDSLPENLAMRFDNGAFSHPANDIKFQVIKAYKGNIEKNVELYSRELPPCGNLNVKEMIIFANENHLTNKYLYADNKIVNPDYTVSYSFCIISPSDNVFYTIEKLWKESLPPLQQIKNGIKPQDVICKEGLQLIFKDRNSPACVNSQTVFLLLSQRSWSSFDDISIVLQPSKSEYKIGETIYVNVINKGTSAVIYPSSPSAWLIDEHNSTVSVNFVSETRTIFYMNDEKPVVLTTTPLEPLSAGNYQIETSFWAPMSVERSVSIPIKLVE